MADNQYWITYIWLLIMSIMRYQSPDLSTLWYHGTKRSDNIIQWCNSNSYTKPHRPTGHPLGKWCRTATI